MPTLRLMATLKDDNRPDEEVRLTAQVWKRVYRFDIRLFWRPKGSQEFNPTRRGVTLNAKMTIQLRNALAKLGETEFFDLMKRPLASPGDQTMVQGTTTTDISSGG